MPPRPDPSQMLATLCASIERWVRQGRPVDDWLVAAEIEIEDDPVHSLPAEAMTPAELRHHARAGLAVCDARVIPNARRFVEVLRALVLIDDWHDPLARPGPGGMLPTDAHETAWLRLAGGGGYNPDPASGLIIPRSCPGVTQPNGRRAELPNALLHSVTWVPPVVDAGDPDGEDLTAPARSVAVRYLPPSLLRLDPRPTPGAEPVVAVAPVHQDAGDAAIVSYVDPDRYGLAVGTGAARLPEIMERAVFGDAHLLFLPEMSIEEEALDAFSTLVRATSARHLVATGRLPALRYVVAGCVSRADPSTSGRNFVVILDHEGLEVARQHKLTRWNLKPHHRYSYGLTPVLDQEANELYENIEVGGDVWIVDLPGIGRMSTLICADMSHAEPGGFLIRNVDLDWLHAPIMDRTNAPLSGAAAKQPWMIERAVGAACAGVRRVVVTNSVLFTTLINVTNGRKGSAFSTYPSCSIAFMLQRDGGALTYRDVEVTVPTQGTVVDIERWNHGFRPFPPA